MSVKVPVRVVTLTRWKSWGGHDIPLRLSIWTASRPCALTWRSMCIASGQLSSRPDHLRVPLRTRPNTGFDGLSFRQRRPQRVGRQDQVSEWCVEVVKKEKVRFRLYVYLVIPHLGWLHHEHSWTQCTVLHGSLKITTCLYFLNQVESCH